MSINGKSAAEAVKRLGREEVEGKPQPVISGNLPLKKLHTAEAIFQPRRGLDFSHISYLYQRVRAEGGTLSPIIVWWSGRRWYVIDGHHRLKAYESFNATAQAQQRITETPVEVFSGSAAEAHSKAVQANSKDKLRMNPADKQNAAWRMVCLAEGGGGATDIARRSGIVRQTVAKMQAHYHDVRKRFLGVQPVDLRWREAMDLVAGRARREWSDDDTEAEAQDRATKFRASHGHKLSTSPDATARALEIYDHSLIEKLVDTDPFHDAVQEYARARIMEGDWLWATLTPALR